MYKRSGFLVLPLYLIMAVGLVHSAVPLNSFTFWQSSEVNVYSTGMIWADCNRDGYIDVFFSNGNDMAMAANSVYLSNYGTLSSTPSWQSSNHEFSGHCAVGDLDDDGFPDLVVANYLGSGGFSTPNLTNLYLNNGGQLSYLPDWFSGDSIWSFSCAFGDADGDGDLDLAVATGEGYNSRYQTDRIYFNVNGSLQATPGWHSTAQTIAMDVTWGDVDNDGDLDLAFCYDGVGAAVHYNNGGVIEGTPSWQSNQAEAANTLIFGDVDGNGWLDLVVAFNNQLGGGGYFRVYFNDGLGNLNPNPGWTSSTGGYGSSVSMYDVDSDGDDDLAAGRWWDSPRIYENTGITYTTSPVWQAGNATVVEELAWVDVDGDGLEHRTDTFFPSLPRQLFYTQYHPLYSMDSIIADGQKLTLGDYCFDLVSGWVSIATAPIDSLVIFYQYSFKNDLAVSNWDTYNMVYGNNSDPLVDFYADTAFGWTPLSVQFSDSSLGASDLNWVFGDGESSTGSNPLHIYSSGGAFDVSLDVLLSDGRHNHTVRKMIVALADTLTFPNASFFADDTLNLPLILTNSQSLEQFIIPVSYNGPLQLHYAGLETAGTRSDYFESVSVISLSPSTRRLVLEFKASISEQNPPLPSGQGAIVILKFVYESGGGLTWIDTTSLSGYSLELEAGYASYQPRVIKGRISLTICGDIDGNMSGPDVADLTYLIDYLFRGGPPPSSMTGADVDGSTDVNVADVTYLVEYLWLGGPPPVCP